MNTQVAKAVEDSEVTEVAQASADVSASEQVLAMIAHASKDGSIDIEAMKAMMQMRKDLVEEQAKKDFNEALAAAQLEMEPVARDAHNKQTNSNYARLEAIAKAITPIRSKHGFALSFGEADCPKDNHFRITCEITHSGGFTKHRYVDLPSDIAGIKGNANKTGIHAFGSSMTYGRRYLTLLIFDIATEDDDGNRAAVVETISEEQVMQLRDLIEASTVSEPHFIKYANSQIKNAEIERLSDIPANSFAGCVTALKKKAA